MLQAEAPTEHLLHWEWSEMLIMIPSPDMSRGAGAILYYLQLNYYSFINWHHLGTFWP